MGIMTTAESQMAVQGRNANNIVALLVYGALIVGVLAGIVFFAFPQIDLKTSEYFYRGGGVFAGKGGGIFAGGPPQTVSDFVRMALYFSFVGVCVLNIVGFFASLVLKRDVLGLGSVKWLFLAICLAAGPGLVGNTILKDHWGRARPVHLVEFGGSKSYTPPLVPSNQCDRNCSFVAGEASMMFATFFAAAFLFPAIGRILIGVGVALGLFSGFIRVSQGAHFVSDVIFAGVAMALTVSAIYFVFKTLARKRASNRGLAFQDPLAGQMLW